MGLRGVSSVPLGQYKNTTIIKRYVIKIKMRPFASYLHIAGELQNSKCIPEGLTKALFRRCYNQTSHARGERGEA